MRSPRVHSTIRDERRLASERSDSLACLTRNGIGVVVNCVNVVAAARLTESPRASRRIGHGERTTSAVMITLGLRLAADPA